jgi:hypothetical protein
MGGTVEGAAASALPDRGGLVLSDGAGDGTEAACW